MMNVLINLMVEILSQCMCISNHHDVYIKYPTVCQLYINKAMGGGTQSYKNNERDLKSHLPPSFCILRRKLHLCTSRPQLLPSQHNLEDLA